MLPPLVWVVSLPSVPFVTGWGCYPPVIVNLPRRPRSWEAASCKLLLLPPSCAHACPSQQHRARLPVTAAQGWARMETGAVCRRAEQLARH